MNNLCIQAQALKETTMTKSEKNLLDAFAGESQANRKYLAFAKKAEAEGLKQIAKLFPLLLQPKQFMPITTSGKWAA